MQALQTLENEEQETESSNQEREEREPIVSEDTQEKKPEETGTSSVQNINERGTFGVDFAEQTDQRQLSLSDRKKQMLQNARK